MNTRLVAAILVVAAAPFQAHAADEESPYKKAKVGDFAIYKASTKISGGLTAEGILTQTIIAKDDKEATVKTSVKLIAGMGQEIPLPDQDHKIDLTKPFDPSKPTGGLQPGVQVNVEKLKEGKEKLKLGGKEYDATWTSYKVKIKVSGMDIDGEMKVWHTKDLNLPIIKMERTAEVMGNKLEEVMELTETGNKDLGKPKDKDKVPDKFR